MIGSLPKATFADLLCPGLLSFTPLGLGFGSLRLAKGNASTAPSCRLGLAAIVELHELFSEFFALGISPLVALGARPCGELCAGERPLRWGFLSFHAVTLPDFGGFSNPEQCICFRDCSLLDLSQVTAQPVTEEEFVAWQFDPPAVAAVEDERLSVDAGHRAFAGRE